MIQEVETRLEQAKDGVVDVAERTSTAAKKGFLDSVERVSRVVNVVRGLGMIDVVRRVGLERKQSGVLEKALAFTGGLVVGAGVALLVAPVSGETTRRRLTHLAGLDDREHPEVTVEPAAKDVLHAADVAPGARPDVAVTDHHEGRPV